MKKTFQEFYKPDYDTLWSDCVFVFDANIFLNLYRFKDETKEAFFEVFEKIGDNKWIPYQVGYEYHKNRIKIIYDIKDVSQNQVDEMNVKLGELRKLFDEIKKRSSFTEKNDVDLNYAFSTFERLAKRHHDKASKKSDELIKKDVICERISELFDGKIGKNYSQEKYNQLCKIAQERFDEKIQPGYMDKGKDGKNKYSDYIIWCQILDFAKSVNKPIVFVTADQKEDWWCDVKGKKLCSPALKKEFYDNVGQEFHMYTSQMFIEHAKRYFELSYSNKVVEEVKRAKIPIRIHSEEDSLQDSYSRHAIIRTLIVMAKLAPSQIDYVELFKNEFKFNIPLSLRVRLKKIKEMIDSDMLIPMALFGTIPRLINVSMEKEELQALMIKYGTLEPEN